MADEVEKQPVSREELRARFLADVKADAERRAKTGGRRDPLAADCWFRIANSYRESAWIEVVHGFPNGLPYEEQTEIDLYLWQLAINARNEGVAKNAGSGRR